VLTIHRSERADALVDALVEVLATPLADAFAAEVVAVPTRGVERWLTHRIGAAVGTAPGRCDGVCANVGFPFPGRLVGDVLAVATGVDRDEDPWRPERLVWPVLEVLDGCAGEPWLAMVSAHLGVRADGQADEHDALRRRRRHPAARHIAELFDRYGVFRPAMVRAWLDRDATDTRLPPDARWQPELLRRVRTLLGVPSPPERIGDACARLQAGEVDLDEVLPERASLFGLTRLPTTYLDVLRAVAAHRDVHLFALHPSLALWERIAAQVDADEVRAVAAGLPRADDPTRRTPRHPLLATWAHDSREMQLVLSAAAEAEVAHRRPAGTGEPRSLLARLQAAVRDDVAPPPHGATAPLLDEGDRSVQVHACHGRGRQVEVLRDAICHLLAADPTLEPRDVIVLCPDIDELAPLLHATFGAHDPDDDRRLGGVPVLPYRLADRSLRQTNPLLGALADLLDLVDHRLTATEVLRFAGRPPVRRRFGLDDDALERIAAWVQDSGIRWGLDAEHRRPWHLHGVADHTWRAGLDRVLLGVAMDTDDARIVGGRLPLDDVDSGDIDLAGRFAELVDRIDAVVDHCCTDRPVGDWIRLLGDAADLLLAAPAGEQWQRVQVDAVLREVVGESGGSDRPLSLAEVRSLLAGRLAGVPTRADFRTGAITMCTLVPMRAVPHRVVCLLGLDDGAFPRVARADGDDLLQRDPLVGDRDPRTEDRQLLLDAVLAAEQALVVTYTGHDERTNEPRSPSVPLAELLDVLDRTARTATGEPAGQAAVRHHPLQPFDPRAFAAEAPWSFDPVHLAGAEALTTPRCPPRPFLSPALPDLDGDDAVGLDELVRFVQDPLRELLRQRLGISTWDDDDQLPDAIPIELDGLQRWAVGQDVLRRLLTGIDLDTAVRAAIAAGTLPPGELRQQPLREVANCAAAIRDLAEANGVAGPPTSLEVDVDADAGGRAVRVLGTVPGVHGDVIADVSFSSLSPKCRLALWVRLLAASAARPDREWCTVGIGRDRAGGKLVRHQRLAGPPEARRAEAARLLGELVELRRRGLREPLPLPCKTSEAWATAVQRGRDPREAATRCWSSDRYSPEAADPSVVRTLGEGRSLDDLLALGLEPLALALWQPILAQEAWR